MRLFWIVGTVIVGTVAALLVGCGSSSHAVARVPDVRQQPLDAAEDALDAKGLQYDAVGGGLFGVVVRSHWTVCRQAPKPGALARHVTLYVARECGRLVTRFVPDVVRLSLPEAEEQLERGGFDPDEQSLSGDAVVVESRWTVCNQWPAPGDRAYDGTVTLYVAHDCYEEEN